MRVFPGCVTSDRRGTVHLLPGNADLSGDRASWVVEPLWRERREGVPGFAAMNPPAISVSMHDAANTREDEKPDICEECDNCPEECRMNAEDCEETMAQAAAEERFEAMRDAYE
jgi:hypothetical protein